MKKQVLTFAEFVFESSLITEGDLNLHEDPKFRKMFEEEFYDKISLKNDYKSFCVGQYIMTPVEKGDGEINYGILQTFYLTSGGLPVITPFGDGYFSTRMGKLDFAVINNFNKDKVEPSICVYLNQNINDLLKYEDLTIEEKKNPISADVLRTALKNNPDNTKLVEALEKLRKKANEKDGNASNNLAKLMKKGLTGEAKLFYDLDIKQSSLGGSQPTPR